MRRISKIVIFTLAFCTSSPAVTAFGKNAIEPTKEERIAEFANLPVAEKRKPEFFEMKLVAEHSAERVKTAHNPPEIKLNADEELLVFKTVDKGTKKREFLIVETKGLINRTHIADCYAVPGQFGWELSIKFTELGGRLFGDVTGNAVGRRFAMVVGGSFVLSAPNINEPILGGGALISGGNLTEKGLRSLASLFEEPKAAPAK